MEQKTVGLNSSKGPRIRYKVKWAVGRDGKKYAPSWEDESSLGGCKEVMDAFKEKQDQAKKDSALRDECAHAGDGCVKEGQGDAAEKGVNDYYNELMASGKYEKRHWKIAWKEVEDLHVEQMVNSCSGVGKRRRR